MENTPSPLSQSSSPYLPIHFDHPLEYFRLPFNLPFQDHPMCHILVIAGRFRHDLIIPLSCVRTSSQL